MDMKKLLVALRPQIDAALAEVAKANGLKSLKCGNATFSPDGNFVMKLEGLVEGGLDKDAERYKNSAAMLGLPPLGTEVKYGAKVYTIAGLNSTGSKCQIAHGGKRYLIPTDNLRDLCKAQALGGITERRS